MIDFVQIRVAVKGTLTLKVNVHIYIYIYIIYNIYIYIYGDRIGKNLNSQVTGEPILLNANSYQNIDSVLQSFKDILRNGEEREWAVLGFKGRPFCLNSRVIEKNPFKYDWVSIVSGLGHLNMNQLKTFFRIVNEICLKIVGKNSCTFIHQRQMNILQIVKTITKHGNPLKFCFMVLYLNS